MASISSASSAFALSSAQPEDKTPLHEFTGTPDPYQMHAHILHKKHRGLYYSFTTMPEPYKQWAPLKSHRDMETRPCHFSKSRIHRLRCGHQVAVPREAEQCAPNCSGMAAALGEKAVGAIKEDWTNMVKASKAYLEMLGNGLFHVDDRVKAFVRHMDAAHSKMTQDYEHSVMKEAGDFKCVECRIDGGRPTVPVYNFNPMHIIIVVRDDQDRELVKQLNKGIGPKSKKFEEAQAARNKLAQAPSAPRAMLTRDWDERQHRRPRNINNSINLGRTTDGRINTHRQNNFGGRVRGGEARGGVARGGNPPFRGGHFNRPRNSGNRGAHRGGYYPGPSAITRARKEEKSRVTEELLIDTAVEEMEDLLLA